MTTFQVFGFRGYHETAHEVGLLYCAGKWRSWKWQEQRWHRPRK